MSELIRFEAAAFKSRINSEIDNSNVGEVERLVDQYCEAQGFNEMVDCPEDFAYKLKQLERRNRFIKKNKICKVVAIVAAIACLAGATVYAATNYFAPIKHSKYGLVTEDFDEEDLSVIDKFVKETLPEAGEAWKVLDKEEGNQETKWTQKITSESTFDYQTSDRVHWTKTKGGSRKVEYLYDDFMVAQSDTPLPDVITKELLEKLSLKDTVSYVERYFDQSADITISELDSDFNYAKVGKVHFIMRSDLTLAEGEEKEFGFLTGDQLTSNQRNYITQNGVEFPLSDNELNGITRTSTLLISGRYILTLSFTDMTEDQIHEVLEAIDTSAFTK